MKRLVTVILIVFHAFCIAQELPPIANYPSNGDMILGTIANGIVVLTDSGEFRYQIDLPRNANLNDYFISL